MLLPNNIEKDMLFLLQTDRVTVSIKGSASHPDYPGVDYSEAESSIIVSSNAAYEVSFSKTPYVVSEQYIGDKRLGTYTIAPVFFEQQDYEIVIESEDISTVEFWHENYNIRKKVTKSGTKSKLLTGVLNFANEIGFSDLIIRVDGKEYLKITIEVFPAKIDYKDDYEALVKDITAEVYNLAFDFLKKTYATFDISSKKQSSPVEFFAILQKIYKDFIVATDMIIANPHHLLTTEHPVLPSHKVKRIDTQTIKWLEKHPGHVIRTESGFSVDKAMAVKKHVTYDTKENRLVKYMLLNTIKRLERFKQQYISLDRKSDEYVLERINKMCSEIKRRCVTGVLSEVEATPSDAGMSLVFGMAPGYRRLYRCYLMLQHGLSVTGSVFNVSLKDLAKLYEYWCFIKLNSLLKQHYKIVSQDIIKITSQGIFVQLSMNKNSSVKYKNIDTGELIELSYNLPEREGPTVSQKPDNVLSLQKRGADIEYEYVFDAKYKIDPAKGTSYQTKYLTPGPKEEDINTMHRYRDAIVTTKQNDSFYKRIMFGAYVLFPYRNLEEYRNHQFYKSIESVNIGGLPFLPAATSMVSDFLDELIMDSPETAFERATLPKGIEQRLAKVDWTHKDVIIGYVPDNQMMQQFRSGRYYYVAKTKISADRLPIYYVALYQPNNGITYYGKVLETRLVKQGGLPGKHRDPQKVVYCFSVEEWKRLPITIRPEQYGPSPVAYTNYFLLTHSSSYPELHLQSEEEYRFFSELKRRANNVVIDEGEETGFELNGKRVAFQDGIIRVFDEGEQVVSSDITVQEFSNNPNKTFKYLMGYLSQNESGSEKQQVISGNKQ